MSAKKLSSFVCSSCGYESVQWYGKCPNCGEWNTMVEFRENKMERRSQGQKGREASKPIKLSEVKTLATERISSGIGELDRVLGGGFVLGEVVLLAGEPGVGKSTLLLGLAGAMGSGLKKISAGSQVGNSKLLYVSGEESPEQIKTRAERLGLKGENILIMGETQVERIIESAEELIKSDDGGERKSQSHLLVIDSIQTLWSEEIEGSPGSISQVKGCTQKLIELAKKSGIPVVLIGQINKEGEIAGPMMLSHMVDSVLFLEGERFTELRLLRGFKNRFGPTDEVGVFRMTEKGMEEVSNPSELFLKEEVAGEKGVTGSVVVCTMEGTRPVLVEVEALVTQSSLAIPRRVANGVDYNKVSLLTAVLQKVLGLPLYNQDVFVKVGGGFKISEPAVDLGICLAIVSSFREKPILAKTVAFGEVGLLGEIRRVVGEEKREKEAKKLGFQRIISAKTAQTLREAIRIAGL